MTPIDDRITDWLARLERELAYDDAAVRHDAVADAREHLMAARADLPDDADDGAVAELLADYGDPVEVANSYRDAERCSTASRSSGAAPRSTHAAPLRRRLRAASASGRLVQRHPRPGRMDVTRLHAARSADWALRASCSRSRAALCRVRC